MSVAYLIGGPQDGAELAEMPETPPLQWRIRMPVFGQPDLTAEIAEVPVLTYTYERSDTRGPDGRWWYYYRGEA